METVFLIRHGEVYNPDGKFYGCHIDLPLSEDGSNQMKELAKILKSKYEVEVPSILYYSPMIRTKQSAEILARNLSISVEKVISDEAFLEVDSKGLVGYTIKELVGIDIYLPDQRSFLRKYGKVWVEPQEKVSKRIIRGVQEAFEENPNKKIGIVSHCDAIAFALFGLFYPGEEIPSITNERIKPYVIKEGDAFKLSYKEGRGFFSPVYIKI